MAGKSSPKYYAVRKGRNPGVYRTWDECKNQVEGFAGAQFKSFPTARDAEEYLGGRSPRSPAAPGAAAAAPAAPIVHDGSIVIYADGACIRNPGPGGYGTVILSGGARQELSGGFRKTTNNRMEILGCIAGLSTLEAPSKVTVYSDSKYVVNAISQSWAVRWKKNGWKRKDESGEWQPALNSDLWAQMLELCDEHQVSFNWVRGHAGNVENERCDVLARTAAEDAAIGIDEGYERPVDPDRTESRRRLF